MKTIYKLQVLLGFCCPALAMSQAMAPQIPLGTLSVNRNLLQVGTSPTLSWHASFPQPVADMITVNTDHSVVTKKPAQVTVRLLGVAFQAGSLQLPAQLSMRLNDGSWSTRFLGAANDVKPNIPVYTGVVPANTKLDFRFVGASGKSKNNPETTKAQDWQWNYPAVATSTTSVNKAVLQDGQPAPSYAPAYSQGSIKSFLTSVMSADGTTVKVGPRDVIYLTELSTAEPNTTNFDMQDMVLLVTFDEVP